MTVVMPEVLYWNRVEEWYVDLLNENDQLIRRLDEFSGGSYEQNVFSTIRGGGSLDLKFQGEPDISWGSSRVKIWYREASSSTVWPMGVFLISVPRMDYDDETDMLDCQVAIIDKLAVLDQDAVDGSFSLAAGVNVTRAVKDLILSAGESRMSVTDSDHTLSSGRVWEAGTTKLRVINDLLDSINYWALWADGDGFYRTSPYIEPKDRPVSFEFNYGDTSIHLPSWTKEQDWFEVPNKVVLVTHGDDEEPALIGTATNTDPSSPYSYPSRGGRWIVLTETGVEAVDQATITAMARRRLTEASSKVTNLDVTHAVANLWPNDRVRFSTPVYTGTATVSSYSVDLHPGSLVEATWREVDAESV